MKQISITVTDEQAKTLLPLIIGEVDEITVTRIGDDPPLAVIPETSGRKVFRGDKTATDIVLEMFDDENHVRSNEAIKSHLQKIGFGENTGSATISKMVQRGILKRLGKDAVQFIPEEDRPQIITSES